MWNIISGFDTLITEYIYNSQDQIIIYSHSGNGDPKTFRNTYDPAGRLDNVKYYAGWPDDPYPNYVNLAEYIYNENSQLSQQLLNDGGIENYYFYNNRNWISYLQSKEGLFEYTNDYFKNGNVKWQEFTGDYNNNFTNTADLTFEYKYDKSNRLLETEYANSQNNDDFKLENKYDKDGNILELKRYNGSGNLTDDFNYTYYSGTNKLQKVTGTDTQYEYDFNGNMKTDNLNRNRGIKYDHRNLITQLTHKQIVFEDSLLYSTYYYYDEAGNRIRKKVYQYTGIQPADSVTPPEAEEIGDSPGLWDLVKDEVYSRSVDGRELVLYVNGSLKQSNIWGIGNEGYLTNADELYFYLKDHLGSIRALTNDKNEVISSQDGACPRMFLAGDAWGYMMQGRQYDSDESVYKFTGKERDAESEYDYFGARYYDARVGRWGSVDKMQEERLAWSPYNYVLDNPLNKTDLNGLLDRPIYDIWGSFLGTDDLGLQGDAIIMNKENFVQGMSPESAASYDLGIEGLSGIDAQMKFSSHYENLPNRPDYDGYLTLDEANEWYQTGSGEPLFTSLEKIDLSGIYSLGETYVGDERSFNLFLNSNTLNDALVYGSITLKRYSGNQVRAYSDKYNFEMHNILDPTNLPRNLATLIGKNLAGEGKTFNINIYGSKKLEPLFPWTK